VRIVIAMVVLAVAQPAFPAKRKQPDSNAVLAREAAEALGQTAAYVDWARENCPELRVKPEILAALQWVEQVTPADFKRGQEQAKAVLDKWPRERARDQGFCSDVVMTYPDLWEQD
jgi:hypothetical protein